MAPSQRLSGMQKQVLGLYRNFLRAARLKAPEERQRIESVISLEFRQNARNVDRKNFLYIEYLIRRGKKQLELLKSADTVGLATVKFTPHHHHHQPHPLPEKAGFPSLLPPNSRSDDG